MSKTIYVRRRHILAGKPKSMTRCPVALAVKEATKSKCVCVLNSIIVDGIGYPPKELIVNRFICDFDAFSKPRRIKLKPFKFTLQIGDKQ